MGRKSRIHEADTQTPDSNEPALEQGHTADQTAQNFVGPTEADAMGKQEHVPTAEEASRAYAESEVDRSNRVAREHDERALDKDGKPKESKAERFKRLAQKRVTKALAVLGHIHNLTNSNSYSYTPEQAQKVVDALVLAVNKIVDGFSGSKNGKVTFTL